SVREPNVDLLAREVAPEEQQEVRRTRGAPGREDAGEHGTDGVPDLAPGLLDGLAELAGMLGLAGERDVRVVGERREPAAEEDDDRDPRREAEAHRVLEVGGPGLRGPERGLRPIERAHAPRHLGVAGEQPLEPRWPEGAHGRLADASFSS